MAWHGVCIGEAMIDEVAQGLESHFMTALLVSSALALLIVAGVGLAWTGGKRWVRARGIPTLRSGHTMRFSGDRSEPRSPESEPGHENEPGTAQPDHPGARFVREAAARTASLRDAWDRSYREARGNPAGPEPLGTDRDLESLIHDIRREQRETNALLRQLLERLEPPTG